jgi:hypothetical protein
MPLFFKSFHEKLLSTKLLEEAFQPKTNVCTKEKNKSTIVGPTVKDL